MDLPIIIPEFKIERKVRKLAGILSKKFKKNSTPPVFICILRGGFMFFTDLTKDMSVDMEVDFVRVKSYENQDNSQGVQLLFDIDTKVTGKDIVLVDDISDTGNTFSFLKQHFTQQNPTSITTVSLVVKPSTKFVPDFHIFEIPDEVWISGYGLNNNQNYMRNYRNIYKIN